MSISEINTTYQQPLPWMQAARRANLCNNLLRLDLSEHQLRSLATVSLAGCVEALKYNNGSEALQFARYWSLYNLDSTSTIQNQDILTEPIKLGQ